MLGLPLREHIRNYYREQNTVNKVIAKYKQVCQVGYIVGKAYNKRKDGNDYMEDLEKV